MNLATPPTAPCGMRGRALETPVPRHRDQHRLPWRFYQLPSERKRGDECNASIPLTPGSLIFGLVFLGIFMKSAWLLFLLFLSPSALANVGASPFSLTSKGESSTSIPQTPATSRVQASRGEQHQTIPDARDRFENDNGAGSGLLIQAAPQDRAGTAASSAGIASSRPA